jgi:hypothetical protein
MSMILVRPILLALALASANAFAAQSIPVIEKPADPDAGFVSIFDGKTLDGWDGDPKYWRVENGCLVGEITPETIIQRNTFIIWRGGAPRDFELKVEYRVSDRGNSGINYRSIQLPDAKWSLAGYQADIDNGGRWIGQNYEERGRTFLAFRGQMVRVNETAKPELLAALADADTLKSFIKPGDWNEYHLIVRGNILTHIINDHVMSIVIDDDAQHRRLDGLIGVQVHVGPPMKIEYRHFRLKDLSSDR